MFFLKNHRSFKTNRFAVESYKYDPIHVESFDTFGAKIGRLIHVIL